jgi:SAM-dependent methyltransferase
VSLAWTVLKRLFNVPALVAHVDKVKRSRVDGTVDAELDLYTQIFRNDFLHAGYFDPIPDPETISFKSLRESTEAYARLLVARVTPGQRVLDLGCGTGGLLAMLKAAGAEPVGLTPNPGHAEHIRKSQPGVQVIVNGFESLDMNAHRHSYDVVICSESFHNVPLEVGVRNVREVLKPGGKWVVIDYYRTRIPAYNRSGHPLQAFRDCVAKNGFRMTEEIDVTDNTTPSLAYMHAWASRVALPTVDYATGRFLSKHPVLDYLLGPEVATRRARVKLDALDPKIFARDKRYLLQQFVPQAAT